MDGLPELVQTADDAAIGSQLLSQAGSVRVLGRPINYWTIVARKWFRWGKWSVGVLFGAILSYFRCKPELYPTLDAKKPR